MTSNDSSKKFTDLRKQAEELAQEPNADDISLQNVTRVIYELQVHQIELELQNEELRRVQLELETSRRKYRDLYEFSPVGLLTLDENEQITEANSTLVNMLGINHAKLITTSLSNFIDPTTQDTYHFFFRGLLGGELTQQCEVTLLPINQPPILVRLDGTALISAIEGQMAYRIAVSDVSEQRRLINTLRDTEQSLKAMINSAKDYAIFTFDLVGKIDSWSDGAEQVYGYTADESIGHCWDILFSPEDRNKGIPEAMLKQATAGGYAEDNGWHLHKDGTAFFAEGSLRPIYDDQSSIKGFTKIARDVTPRKRLEELEQRQHHFTKILQMTAMNTSKSLKLGEVLDSFLESIGMLISYDGANIMLFEDNRLQAVSVVGYKDETLADFPSLILNKRFPLSEVPIYEEMISTRQPILFDDMRRCVGWEEQLKVFPPIAYIGFPIIVEDVLLGILNINHLTAGFFTTKHLEPLEILTACAALAIKNALLYQEVQRLTAEEERQSISRDLHDSLSQLVYSSNIIANALPSLNRNHPEELDAHLELLRRLNRGTSAELRKLVSELRANELSEVDLVKMLHQMADAAMGHEEVDIVVDIQGENYPPRLVQMTFYRIAQEALNNALKHAQATQIRIILDMVATTESRILVQDNGQGFDPLSLTGYHLGIQGMHERADKIGAELDIQTEIGKGTEVRLIWHY